MGSIYYLINTLPFNLTPYNIAIIPEIKNFWNLKTF